MSIRSKFPKYVITKTNLHAGWWGNGVVPFLVSYDPLESSGVMVAKFGNLNAHHDWKSAAETVLDVADEYGYRGGVQSSGYVLGLSLPDNSRSPSFAAGALIHEDGQLPAFVIEHFQHLGQLLTRDRRFPRTILMRAPQDCQIELFPIVEQGAKIEDTEERVTGVPIGVAIAITSPTFWSEAFSADGELLRPVPMLVLFRDNPKPCDVAIDTNIGWIYLSVPKMLGEKDWAQFVAGFSSEQKGDEVAS